MLTALLLACSTPENADDTAEAARVTIPPAQCGAGHTFLPSDGMGEILAAEPVPELSLPAATVNGILAAQGYGNLLTATYDVDTWRVRYRTQDRGEPVEATGLVALPKDAGDVPLLLWLHPTMGFTDECAPSGLGLEAGAFPVLFASSGMVVAAPDYLGMNGWGAPSNRVHPYIVAEATAIASLDAARAAVQLLGDQARASRSHGDAGRLIHWGASEGGFAALWTDRYQRGYAPEFTTVATLAGVPPTNILGLAREAATTPGPTSAGLVGVIAGMGEWYGVTTYADVLAPDVADGIVDEMLASCDDFPSLDAAQSLTDLFTQATLDAAMREDWSALPEWGCRLRESSLVGSAVPRAHDAPVFIGTAELDDLVVAAPTREDVPRLCAEGYDITYHECAGLGHVEGAVAGLSTQWAWLQARLAGEPLEAACEVRAPEACDAR